MVHKPKHKVHSFRGLLADGGQDEINLERSNVNLAYRIIKFQIMANNFNTADEYNFSVFKDEQASGYDYGTFDFSNTDLLAAAYLENNATAGDFVLSTVIFDNILFSRNIFVVLSSQANKSCNYYLELEEVPVGAATLMQLKLAVARKLNLQQD